MRCDPTSTAPPDPQAGTLLISSRNLVSASETRLSALSSTASIFCARLLFTASTRRARWRKPVQNPPAKSANKAQIDPKIAQNMLTLSTSSSRLPAREYASRCTVPHKDGALHRHFSKTQNRSARLGLTRTPAVNATPTSLPPPPFDRGASPPPAPQAAHRGKTGRRARHREASFRQGTSGDRPVWASQRRRPDNPSAEPCRPVVSRPAAYAAVMPAGLDAWCNPPPRRPLGEPAKGGRTGTDGHQGGGNAETATPPSGDPGLRGTPGLVSWSGGGRGIHRHDALAQIVGLRRLERKKSPATEKSRS